VKLRRGTVDRVIDRARFALDSFPSFEYQPLPWLGKNHARRAAGVHTRWRAIESFIDAHPVATALDIGCNVGYFSIQLATRGITTVGVEKSPKCYRLFLYAIRKLKLSNAGVLVFDVQPSTVRLLPPADCVLFLSVWHHLVRTEGLAAAGDVLKGLWDKTGTALFFESGENELGAHWNLPPLDPSPDQFFSRYLTEQLDNARVEHLGQHDAFAPDGSPCRRSLFACHRIRP
jgi:SAM-dependent methyltransferase